MTPGPKMAPPKGLSVFHRETFKKVFYSETVRTRPLIFGM